jgi:[ribosomal protein S5]-alanine N-acetyltransferase
MAPQRVEDAEALFEAYGDADLMRYWSSAPHGDVAVSRAYLAPRTEHESWRGWTMRTRADGQVIGTLAMHEHRAGVAEIGYMLIRRHWGLGYAREGVARLIDLLFAGGYRRVMADTDPDNHSSNGLLTTLGFTCEGRLRGEWETHIGVRDSLIWGLLAPEWRR